MVTVVWFHEHEMPKELSRLDYVSHHNIELDYFSRRKVIIVVGENREK